MLWKKFWESNCMLLLVASEYTIMVQLPNFSFICPFSSPRIENTICTLSRVQVTVISSLRHKEEMSKGKGASSKLCQLPLENFSVNMCLLFNISSTFMSKGIWEMYSHIFLKKVLALRRSRRNIWLAASGLWYNKIEDHQ